MIKKISFFFILSIALLSCNGFSKIDSLNYHGRITDESGKGIANVVVSNGIDVVKSDADGNFKVYKRLGSRFVYISVPSGYKIDKFYQPVDSAKKLYDFKLANHASSAEGSNSSFIHLGDTETTSDNGWIADIKNFAANSGSAFIMHTGDICYEDGMEFHSQSVTSETMGVPVFYAIGNHDLVKGKYGEEYFEQRFGPVYYSFNSAGVHYVVLPMAHGDYLPSYNTLKVSKWLEADLAMVGSDIPVVIFNHDLLTLGEEFKYGRVDLNNYNFKAWVYGHWHINYFRQHGENGPVSWTITPQKGGIDNSVGNFGVISMDKDGKISVEHRYFFIDSHVVLPSKGVAVIYNTQADPKSIEYSTYKSGMLVESVDMVQTGKMSYLASGLKSQDYDSARVKVIFGDDKEVVAESGIFDSRLTHITNIDSDIYMASPIYKSGKVYVASVDDGGNGKHAFYSVDVAEKAVAWKYSTRQSIKNSIVYYDGKVCGADADNNIYILDALTGGENKFIPGRMTSLGANVSGSCEDNGILYAGFSSGLRAVNISTGEVLWTNSAWSGGEGSVANHVVAGDLLLAGSNWKALFGHNKFNGRQTWVVDDSSSNIRYQNSTPVVKDGKVYSVNGDKLNIFNLSNGGGLVSHKVDVGFNVATTPILIGSTLISGSANSGLVAIDTGSGSLLWSFKTRDALVYTSPYSSKGDSPLSTVNGKPLLMGNNVWFGASDGYIYCVDVTSGEKVSEISIGAPILNSLTLGEDGKIYCADFSGNIWQIQL
ncbi:MAG: PQQ-binding-like beta-propeller repeat protein [Spirochaetales bacterium]|nr:PQQ-binding-like beta-propeller repeat protein [Spirochaetales bacterium]